MSWAQIKEWTNQTPQKKLVSGLAVALTFSWTIFLTSITALYRSKESLRKEYERRIEVKEALRDSCQREHAAIIEKLQNEKVQLMEEQVNFQRKHLQNMEDRDRYRDSMNRIIEMTSKKLDKAIRNAKNIK
jgi:biopolymer transport protein ExbB/TolQ